MTTLHRWLLAFYSSLLIAVCGAFALLAWDQERQLDVDLRGFRFVSSITSGESEKGAFILLLWVVAMFGVITMLVAIFPAAKARRGVFRLRQTNGTIVEVSAESLESLLEDELERLPDVRQAWASVSMVSGIIQPDVTVVIEPSAHVAHVSAAVVHHTIQTLKERVGLTHVNRPGIQVSYEEFAERPVVAQRPAGVALAMAGPSQPPPAPAPPPSVAPAGSARPEDE